MNNTFAKIIVVVLVLGIAGFAIISYLLRPLAAPSDTNQQPAPMADTTTPTTTPSTDDTADAPSTDPIDNTTPTQKTTYTITTGSKITYSIDETLRGNPFTAVGVSEAVSGEITIDPANPTEATGTIRVNARTFATDSQSRDRMVGRFVLKAEEPQNEFVTFTITDIQNLTTLPAAGASASFTIIGDVTIAGVTNSVAFAATVQQDTTGNLSGNATGTIKRSDFNLTIPEVPSVTWAADEVPIQVTLVATKQ